MFNTCCFEFYTAWLSFIMVSKNLYTIYHQLLQCSVFGSMASWVWFHRKLEFTAYRKKVAASMEQCTYDKKESQLVSACDIATQLKWSCTGQSGELSWVHYGNPKYKHSWGQMTSPWDLMDVIRSIITRPLSMVSLATDSPGNFKWYEGGGGGVLCWKNVMESSKHIQKITGNPLMLFQVKVKCRGSRYIHKSHVRNIIKGGGTQT